MSVSADQSAPSGLSELVSAIHEVQQLQAQTRGELNKLVASTSRAAPVSGLPTGQCVHWLQTNDCKADGPMQVINGVQTTQPCTTPLQSGWSGFCVCGSGGSQTKIGFNCNGGQQGRTCQEICQETGASAYGPLPATDAAACLQGGGVFVGQGAGKGFAAVSPGAYFPGCPADAKCCVPLTGTVNVADAREIVVSGAAGTLSGLNGLYLRGGTGSGAHTVYASGAGQQITIGAGGWTIGPAAGGMSVVASGPFAKDPQRIPVGGHAEPWQSSTGESADASSIRLSAVSKADAARDASQKAALTTRLQELDGVETTLLSNLRTQRIAASDQTTATSLALRAETKAASLIEAESEEQRRRLSRGRGQAVQDTTLIVAARSASLRAKAYTRVTLVSIAVLVAAFVIYRLNTSAVISKDMAFILTAAAGGAGLIVGTIMLNNIQSRNPRDFSKLYFAPPAGLSSDAAAFSSPTLDNGNDYQSCRRALRTARSI